MGNRLANNITGIRLGLTPIIFFSIISDRTSLSLILYLLALITDVLDGFVARITDSTSMRGAFYDAGADFMLVFSGVLGLVLQNVLNIWVLGLMTLMFLKFINGFGKTQSVYDPYGKKFGISSLLMVPITMVNPLYSVIMMEVMLVCLACASMFVGLGTGYQASVFRSEIPLRETTVLASISFSM